MHIPDPRRPKWAASHSVIKQMLDLPKKLPPHGIKARHIQGVKVWVNAAPPPVYRQDWRGLRRVKGSTHRVMCECPTCGAHLSVGRLAQHKCKPTPSSTD